ncbi:D-alanyl-D-alanine carboxypeptidase, partial [Klebsiella pneumoniae]|uniref:D-alanyl-D-alanine carboxypeptidase n=1 Tax=Klebsiella pneumoniae TaxID=573 RepID=UPI0021093DA0
DEQIGGLLCCNRSIRCHITSDLNRYTLTGCLPQRSEPLPLAFAIQDGASYAGAILKAELAQAGITYSGTLLRQTLANEPGTEIAGHPEQFTRRTT